MTNGDSELMITKRPNEARQLIEVKKKCIMTANHKYSTAHETPRVEEVELSELPLLAFFVNM